MKNKEWVSMEELVTITGISRQWLSEKARIGVIRTKPQVRKQFNLKDAKKHFNMIG